jgi:hypothetical protein
MKMEAFRLPSEERGPVPSSLDTAPERTKAARPEPHCSIATTPGGCKKHGNAESGRGFGLEWSTEQLGIQPSDGRFGSFADATRVV